MINEDKPCTEVLIQLAAIRSALAQVGHIVLEGHVNGCVVEAVQQGQAEGAVKDFKKALDIWMKS
jgi:DNA-binding FrmR family transcriptional regulator